MNCIKCNSEHIVKSGKSKGGNQKYLCRNCNKKFTYLPPKSCEDCGIEISNYKNGNKKLCIGCFKNHERKQKRRWWKKTREVRNEYQRDYYWNQPSFRKNKIKQNNINNNKRLGSSGLGSHLSNHCGEIDFELEEQVVKNEVKRMLRYGTHRFNSDAVKWAEWKLQNRRLSHYGIWYLPNITLTIIDEENICWNCWYSVFPSGANECGTCLLNKRSKINDMDKMCYEMLQC